MPGINDFLKVPIRKSLYIILSRTTSSHCLQFFILKSILSCNIGRPQSLETQIIYYFSNCISNPFMSYSHFQTCQSHCGKITENTVVFALNGFTSEWADNTVISFHSAGLSRCCTPSETPSRQTQQEDKSPRSSVFNFWIKVGAWDSTKPRGLCICGRSRLWEPQLFAYTRNSLLSVQTLLHISASPKYRMTWELTFSQCPM